MRNTWRNFILIAVVLLLSSCGSEDTEETTIKTQFDSYTLTNKPSVSILENEIYSYTPTFTPPIEKKVIFTISNRPKWVFFDPDTGTISGTPSKDDIGTDSNIIIEATIGNTTLTTEAFSITVKEVNLPPQISGTPEKTKFYATRAYTFTPTAYDPEGSTLEFFISNTPDWISFDESTGEISYKPTVNDIGASYEITISVSDGKNITDLQPFTLTVKPGLETALISWTPPSENTDGTALKDLAGYRIYYGTEMGKYDEIITLNSTDITSYLIENLPLPEYFFTMTAFDVYGNESGYADAANKRID